ncbi:MAG: hypothetical protein HC857_12655 [Synechococcales cyanobacterium RU_4_20]|nr:hypothetical protein [Synechococcales cyanobacterium RU_4_20]NJR68961.1 hypothetical protein [Synechococcales cyanobacterium CRU_2_2]
MQTPHKTEWLASKCAVTIACPNREHTDLSMDVLALTLVLAILTVLPSRSAPLERSKQLKRRP